MVNPDSPAAEGKTPRKRQRRIQERTEIARANLINAATPMFAERGFEAVSVRDIEDAAGLKRGLLAYHFGSKETLWKATADAMFFELFTNIGQRLAILKDLSKRDSVALLIRFHVRYYAEHPELSRLMSQEGRQNSWRIQYLVEKHIAPSIESIKGNIVEGLDLTERQFAHWYYIMVSASATIFSFSPECEILFGFSPCEESVVEQHAEMLVSMLLGNRSD